MRVPLLRAIGDAQRYGFAVGKVRVLQTRVFGAGTYERLLDAPTFSEQTRVLSDTIYGRYLEDARRPTTSRPVLRPRSTTSTASSTMRACPRRSSASSACAYDYANLRAVLKARALGVSTEGMIVALGTVAPDVVTGPVSGLPEFLGDIAKALTAGPDEEPATVEAIDAVVEAALFGDLVRSAKTAKSGAAQGTCDAHCRRGQRPLGGPRTSPGRPGDRTRADAAPGRLDPRLGHRGVVSAAVRGVHRRTRRLARAQGRERGRTGERHRARRHARQPRRALRAPGARRAVRSRAGHRVRAWPARPKSLRCARSSSAGSPASTARRSGAAFATCLCR